MQSVKILVSKTLTGKDIHKMKKLIALFVALTVIFMATFALAETKISVNGTGETQISADTAIISLGVSARDKDVLQAQQKVNTAIASIRKALIEQGVKEENINTDYINIYAIYDYSGDREQVMAYSADSTLAIKITDIDTVGALIDVSFAAGANTLNGITFSATNTDDAEAESLKKAVSDAKAKAEILAEAAGLKITGIEVMSEGGAYSYSNTVSNFSAKRMDTENGFEEAGTVVQAAKLIVSANVTITFIAE